MQNFEQEAIKSLLPESLTRYKRKDLIGGFEFKRKLDIVMKHIDLKTKSETQEKAAAAST